MTETRPLSLTIYKNQFKVDQRSIVNPKNLKLLKVNIGIHNAFLSRTPIAQETKARIDKWDYIRFKKP
jgi:hypothetical protein